jgi:hypothetical protein
MPSAAFQMWGTERLLALDEVENAHASVGGTARGRRYATQQINQAYAVILSSQFQAFCRDLHSECVDHLVDAVNPEALRVALRAEFALHRTLDRGNPNPGNIGSDFNRLGLVLWDKVYAANDRNRDRRNHLELLNAWRNAIAHQDFTDPALGGVNVLQLRVVRQWRRSCHHLASCFDTIMRVHIQTVTGNDPWV